jgi:hypothetical protein
MSDAVQRDQIIADSVAPKSPHPKMPILPAISMSVNGGFATVQFLIECHSLFWY